MAEALTDRPHPPQRFYCHICSVEIQLDNSDFICPLCSGGFIEELPAPPSDSSSEDVEMSEPNAMDDLDMIRNELATLLMSRTQGTRPPDADLADDEGQQQGQGAAGRGGGGVGRPQRIHRRRHRVQPIDRFDNILLEILQTLSVGNETALGNASMFFMGNPGDYAWGREGIDTIVTQLLNQMDTTGPPPLPKDKIDEIPNVEITQEQVDHKLQCSVCWEDFKLSESVRKLPCLHVYHENCIVRWLELHGTCPICRKSLTPEGPDVTNSLRNVATAFIRTASDDQTANTSSSSSIMSSNSMQTNDPASTSSQQQDMEQLTASETLFNAIPLSLSRILSTPGTSSQQQQPSSSLSRPPNSIISAISQPIIIQQNQGVGGGGGGGGGVGIGVGFHPQQFHQQQPQQQQQQQQQRSDANSDRGGAGGSGSGNGDGANNTTNSSSSSSNRTDQHDYKYDDEFD